MIRLLAVLFISFTCASHASADDRLLEYEDCWLNAAHSVPKDGLRGSAYEDAVMASIDKANKDCNSAARHAAATNGKDAVNAQWRYMEVQFANGHLREAY